MVRPRFGHGPLRSPPVTAREHTRSPPRWPRRGPTAWIAPTGYGPGTADTPPGSLTMTRQWLAGLGLLATGLVAGWAAARSQAPPGDKPDPAPAPDRVADRGRPLDMLDWMVGDWVDDDD